MISIDRCDGTTTYHDIAPDRLQEFLASLKRPGRPGRTAGNHLVWVDVHAPTPQDWATLEEEFDFHPLALEDASKQNQRAKVDVYDDHLFLSIKAWKGNDHPIADLEALTTELDIFLGANYLVTVHQDACTPIQETRRRLQQHPQQLRNEPGFLLYLLLDALVDEYFPAMDALDAEIEKVEMAIYESQEAPDFKPAIALRKRLLLLRQAVCPFRDVINQLLRIDDPKRISPRTRVFYQDVYDHTLRLVEQVDLHRDILGGVMDVMMSQTSNRLNQVMKTLTGISTILMSAALVAGIYGMNFKRMPELEWAGGYYAALGLMVGLALALTLYFKKIRWF